MKEYMKMSTEQKRQYKLNEIMNEVNLLKEQKRKNDEFRDFIKNEELAQNKNKCEFIKTQQLLQEEKKRAQELEKINKIKNELERKILEEQSMKENAENKLTILEQEEIDVMKRIRTTTQVHKASKKK
jgi:organic radical activating enzyme